MVRCSKFNVSSDASSRTCDGIVFDSALEMRYYRDVIIPGVESGAVAHWERQKKYILQDKFTHGGKTILPIDYKADFFIVFNNGRELVVDIKGCPDNTAKLKRKLFWHRYPNTEYVWVTYVKKFGGWVEYDKCKQLRKQAKKIKTSLELK